MTGMGSPLNWDSTLCPGRSRSARSNRSRPRRRRLRRLPGSAPHPDLTMGGVTAAVRLVVGGGGGRPAAGRCRLGGRLGSVDAVAPGNFGRSGDRGDVGRRRGAIPVCCTRPVVRGPGLRCPGRCRPTCVPGTTDRALDLRSCSLRYSFGRRGRRVGVLRGLGPLGWGGIGSLRRPDRRGCRGGR